MSDEMIERVAKAIYDAEDPNSGDHIATTIHCTEHIPCHGTIAEQLEQVMETCRSAARAALEASGHTALLSLVEAAYREGFQAARECLTDDEAFTLTEDVEEDRWQESKAAALSGPLAERE